MKKILVFVASGFSTRMGGFPKGLAKVNDVPVIANAINNAAPYYESIYVICNFKTEDQFKNIFEEYNVKANLRPIVTGKGDAESVLKSIELIQKEIHEDFDCTFCWGDAFFVSELPFKFIMKDDISVIDSIVVGCSVDEKPYAYFDIQTSCGNLDGAKILNSYFKKINGAVDVGIHDQCIFRCISSVFLERLANYRVKLGYNGADYTKSPTNEMGLLNSFTFFNEVGKSAIIKLMPGGNVLSFNTFEELREIEAKINAH